ncbi:MAG: glycerophosphodiester phosphodiesterase family protein [Pseudomonadota bacterium]
MANTAKNSLAPDWLTAVPIAHRALHDGNVEVAENSVTAFQRSITGGYAIECDLQISKTGEPVVFHDDDLDRLTVEEGFVRDKTPAELAQLDLSGTDDTIQTLATHLKQVAGKVPLILELKGVEGFDAGLVEGVAEALKSYEGAAAVMSFDHWLCAQFAEKLPGIPRGLTAYGDESRADINRGAMRDFDLTFISYHVRDLPTAFVRENKEAGVPIITWTVRNEEQARLSYTHADQITFELFNPDAVAAASKAQR